MGMSKRVAMSFLMDLSIPFKKRTEAWKRYMRPLERKQDYYRHRDESKNTVRYYIEGILAGTCLVEARQLVKTEH